MIEKLDNKMHMRVFKDASKINSVKLGYSYLTVADVVAISRFNCPVEFSEAYRSRVFKARDCVEKWISEGKIMYGITTGFGALCDQLISQEDTALLQKNIVLSHSTSVGDPLSIEATRAIMVVMLSNMGQGYSGVRLELLERLQYLLNMQITPYVPKEGSVGYLSLEAHIGLTIIGLGKAYYQGKLYQTEDLYHEIGLEPLVLAAKEGLSLTSGTTSPTALAALTVYDAYKAVITADGIAAMALEVSKGTIKAFDERLMSARPYEEQSETAKIIRDCLADSEIAIKHASYRLQDALSLRAVPQLHGAVKRTIYQSLHTVEQELNQTSDNPIIWCDSDDVSMGEALSGCHCDASYIGAAMDSLCIAMTMLAKMSERRNYRLISHHLSGMPWFLIKNPGLNSGLMIPQYTQAGLLNDMKILSTPASVDNIPTCGGQEDYVSLGYNASKKAYETVKKLEYILGIELLSVYQSYAFYDGTEKPGSYSQEIIKTLSVNIPFLEKDCQLSPFIELLKDYIHNGTFIPKGYLTNE